MFLLDHFVKWSYHSYGKSITTMLLLLFICQIVSQPHGLQPAGILCSWISQARIWEWVALSFYRGSSQLRDLTRISCLAGEFFTTEPLWFSSVQSLSRVRLFVTPWIVAHQASLSITNYWSSLKLTSIQLVMPSSHLILCCPLLLLPPILPSIRVFSNESTLHMRWPKYWSFSFSIPPGKPQNNHAAAKSLQLCPTLCDPIDGSPPGSPVPGILQARTLEWVAISFSNARQWKVKGRRSVVSDS